MRPIDADALEKILRTRCAQCNDDYGNLAGAVSGCLKLVQSLPTITPPPNDPLALEELREMDGEPVWNDTVKKWMLVDLLWEFGERAVGLEGKWRDLHDRYYDRPLRTGDPGAQAEADSPQVLHMRGSDLPETLAGSRLAALRGVDAGNRRRSEGRDQA